MLLPIFLIAISFTTQEYDSVKHLFIQFPPYNLSTGPLREVKNEEYFKLSALKVVVVTYEGWLLTKGSKYSDFLETFGILENWKLRRGGCLREVITTGGLTVS